MGRISKKGSGTIKKSTKTKLSLVKKANIGKNKPPRHFNRRIAGKAGKNQNKSKELNNISSSSTDKPKQNQKHVAALNFRRTRTKNVPEKQKSSNHAEHQEVSDDESEEELDEEDVSYFKSEGQNTKFMLEIRDRNLNHQQRKRKWEKENQLEEYEQAPREMEETDPRKKMKALLPVKHKSGLEYRWEQKTEILDNSVTGDEPSEEGVKHVVKALPTLSTVELYARRQQKLEAKKKEVAVLANGIIQDPEFSTHRLKALCMILHEDDVEIMITIRKLVMVSMLEVFKDIVPGYRIREWGEKANQVKLSKGVKILRDFEEGLLKYFKHYLEFLELTIKNFMKPKRLSKMTEEEVEEHGKSIGVREKLAVVASKCLCDLAASLSHFNFHNNILSVIVPLMACDHKEISDRCCETMKTIFRQDLAGHSTLAAVKFISQLVRSKSYKVDPKVLDTFLSLRIKEVNVKDHNEERKKKVLDRKQKKMALSRSQRRHKKQLEKLEVELQAANAAENKKEKLKLHTDTIQVVFTTYFRILKKSRKSALMPSVLEGLAKFAHLINLEFFDDLVQVLNSLIESGDLQYRESLHCVLTAMHILSGQGEVLNIDPTMFYNHLYTTMLSKNFDRQSSNDARIILECLDVMINKKRKLVNIQRVLAFIKRLTAASLQSLPNAAMAFLACAIQAMKAYPRSDLLLDNESSGSGVYQPELMEPEHCCAQNTALWELHLMKKHYHPSVHLYAQHLLKGCPVTGAGSLDAELARRTPVNICEMFDPSKMNFHPTIESLIGKAPSKKHQTCTIEDFIQAEFQDLVSKYGTSMLT
ncbi:nucleolar complex protein 3 homolog [Anneissia japonica]|uniref:nucleolar complex protein 3 homolog n=1 Tax=Anneissia japonica TaxID=1529436 RepID=UPI001425A4B7|nr:nucleolar complex protein 3 homolog [Anneissia japonica]